MTRARRCAAARRWRWTAGAIALTGAGCATTPPPDVRTLPPGLHTERKTVYYEVDALSITSMKAASERMADQQLDRDEHGTLFWSYAR
ncbi:MAG TPA: hypothetical protein VMH39_00305 [Gemmatimonadaceae bacterium]|nr:hypothetical protein [Gemmatimonadaceae bacterium]